MSNLRAILLTVLALFTGPVAANSQAKQVPDTTKTRQALRAGSVFGPTQFNFISWQDNMMGASPEAARMTRYSDTPVSYAYGQAEIGIPIYTVQGRQLSLPITLSYDSSGIKPEEISGIVGLGWCLQAGGVITRSIIGLRDNGMELLRETNDPDRAQYYAGFANSSSDTNYDLYSYSFCGHSGSFYIIPGRGIVPLEPTELIISSSGGYTITDTDGTQYVFGQSEMSSRYMGSNDPDAPLVNNNSSYYQKYTSWYLTEIRSMDGTEVIHISYRAMGDFSNVRHSYYRSISFPYRYGGNGTWITNLLGGNDPTPTFQTREWSYTSTNTWYPYAIDTISFPGGRVVFDYEGYSPQGMISGSYRSYPYTLSSITVKDSGENTVGRWLFSRSITGDNRILLASVTQKGNDGSTTEKWTMEYDAPTTEMTENAQDLFGYYNGQGGPSKAFLRPYNDQYTIPFQVANRSYSSAHVGKLSLKSITTASGSRTRYQYEPNSISSNGQSDLFPTVIEIGQRISRIRTYDLSGGTERLVRSRVFTYSNPGITVPRYAFQSGAYISTDEYNTIPPDGVGAGYWYGPNSPIRIGSVVYNDQSNLPGMPLESARIFYNAVTEDVTDESFKTVRTVWEYNGAEAESTGGGGAIWAPSDNHDNYYTDNQSHNHFHQRVPKYIPRNGPLSNSTSPLGYHIKNQNRPQLNHPVRVTRYKQLPDGQFVVSNQTVYTYDRAYEYLQEGFVVSFKVSVNINGYENTNIHCLSDIDQQQVDRKIYYLRLREREDKEYLDDGTVKSVKTSYAYDFTPGSRTSFYGGGSYFSGAVNLPAMGTLQSPRQETQVYDNDPARTYSRNIIYPDELANLSAYGWADSLASLHYLRPVGEELLIGSGAPQMAGHYQTWRNVPITSWQSGPGADTFLKPYKMEIYRNGQDVGPSVSYTAYDAAGRPLSIQIQGQPAKSYAWGYLHRFPIAEVTGPSFPQLRSSLSASARARLDILADADSLSSAQGDLAFLRGTLRDGLANAMTLLRSYASPFGVTREEDPAGRALLYDYDPAGRLSIVRDEQGNKVQEYVYHLVEGENGLPNSIEKKTFTSQLGTGSPIRDIRFFDGLGRSLQEISVGASTGGKDLVKPFEPDFLDREDAKDYLPYGVTGSGSYRGNAISEQQAYYGAGVKAYTEHHYETSGRERVLSSSLPGFTEVTSHSTAGSAANSVLKLTYDSLTQTVSADGYYPAGRFTVNITEGPDGSRSETYTDEYESPYLERVYLDGSSTWADTYHIRDAIGRIVCVVPPAEAAQLTATTSGFSAANCYTYEYDARDRIVKRKMPAQVEEAFTYNDADLPLTRSRLAAGSPVLEVFATSYDSFNRSTQETYQYGNTLPVTLVEYAYDTYPSWAPSFQTETGYVTLADKDSRTRGLKTAERVCHLSGPTIPAQRAFYYDRKGNVIQSVQVDYDGKSVRTSDKYGFTGALLEERQRVTPGMGLLEHLLDKSYTYDSRQRLLDVAASLDGGAPASVSFGYDDLQRITSTEYGSGAELTQTGYTLQGWLASASSTSWEQTLRYQSPSRVSTDALPGKAGLITEWTSWQKGIASGGANTSDTYAFSYDKAGRLTGSVRYEGTSTAPVNTLTEQGIIYDHSGNLLTLNRFDESSGTAPAASLSFTYTGPNRNGWVYDVHGNVTYDPVSNRSISWNAIGLPEAISSGPTTTQRSYLSNGTLESVADGTVTRLYLGDMVFTQSGNKTSLESASWDGGVLLPGTGADKALYSIKDHLGSIRVVVDGTGVVRQRFDYYPYGSVSRSWSSSSTDSPDKRYRFGGKEIAGEDYLDFGARLYSPGTAMWMSQDPMLEDYYPIGPYAYCAGNPVNVVDPDGKDIVIRGVDGSSVVIFTSSFDNEWDLSSYGINFQGNYYFDGIESATSFLDAFGIVDPSFICDGFSAILNFYQGRYWDSAFSAAAAFLPYLGDLPKVRHADDLWEIYNITVHSHHIIPKALFKKMDDLNYVLKRDSKLNRIIVPSGFHGNHPAYTDWIRKQLSKYMKNGRITPEDVQEVIKQASSEINKAYLNYSKTGERMNSYFKRLNQINP